MSEYHALDTMSSHHRKIAAGQNNLNRSPTMRKKKDIPPRESQVELEATYEARRKNIIRRLKGEAALFCSAPEQVQSRDLLYPYRQNSDLFYLTGFEEPEAALVLIGTGDGPRSVLFVRERNIENERWVGERLGVKRARRKFRVDEVRDIQNFETDICKLLQSARTLHYAAGTNPTVDTLIWKIFQTHTGPRSALPVTMSDARLITGEMRSTKDRREIQLTKHAATITAFGFEQIARELKSLSSEAHAARVLESHFVKRGASGLAFPTIVASGKNATVLHHHPQLQPLWKKELVLIDAGATYRGYCADVTRVFPVSGKFSAEQADVYDIVHEALVAATAKAKPGNTLNQIHDAAVRVITSGLVDLKILRGNISDLIEQGKFRKYFMHRSGHWLGIDVHDISPPSFGRTNNAHSSYTRPLVAGNMFTIEPGIYIDVKDETVPRKYRGIGVRLEDNVVLTENNARVLTSAIPLDRETVEQMVN